MGCRENKKPNRGASWQEEINKARSPSFTFVPGRIGCEAPHNLHWVLKLMIHFPLVQWTPQPKRQESFFFSKLRNAYKTMGYNKGR